MVKRGSFIVLFSLALISFYALATRAFAFFQPYHQDEYKWALWANPFWNLGDTFPHPGLALAVYHHVGAFIGYDHLRLVPAFLSLCIMVLLFIYVRRSFGVYAATSSAAIYALSFYALLGSVQIDIDGAFLPLATLVSFLGYAMWRDGGFAAARWGLGIGILGLCIGFAAKLSFVLVPIAIILDVLWHKPELVRSVLRREFMVPAAICAAGGALVLALVWNNVPFLRYVDNFVALGGRDYFQLLFLTVKGLIYLSPLIVFGIILGFRYARDLSPWFIFLGLNILFYFVIFDFSHRTFDRYLLFFVLPGAVIAGVALTRLFLEIPKRYTRRFILLTVTSLVVSAGAAHFVFSLPHRVVPLIPKSAFVGAVLHGDWGIVLPLTGGSGPMGFYLPVDGLALLWGLALCAAILLLLLRPTPYAALAIFIGVSLSYNFFVTTEYMFGRYYGSAPHVMRTLVADIDVLHKTDPILTYNDIGAYELYTRGIYAARFYPHAEFVENNVEKFKSHTGQFLIVQMPELNPASGYARYFGKCSQLATSSSGLITGAVLDCTGVSPEIIRE